MVARQHHQTDTTFLQHLYRLDRGCFHRITDATHSKHSCLIGKSDHGFDFICQTATGAFLFFIQNDTLPAQPFHTSCKIGFAVYPSADTATGVADKVRYRKCGYITERPDHSLGQRMLGTTLQTIKYTTRRRSSFLPDAVGQHRTALGNGTGLVEHYGINFTGSFQTLRIFYQNSQFGSLTDSHHNRCRGSQSQRTRTGNDQHGYHRQNTEYPTVFGFQQSPRQEGDKRNAHDHRHKDRCDAVHQPLNGRLATLRFLHLTDNLCQKRVSSHLGRLESK